MGISCFVTSSTIVSAYTTGMSIKGTYAEDWKTKFPDRTTLPYRKLVIAS